MFSWVSRLNSQVRILAIGRFLSEIGTGFTLFYAPIFFVNQVGLSATQVGLALGSASISGVVGRVLGGSWSDSPAWGRRGVLLLSSAVCAVASLVLATAANFFTLVLGNLLIGFGIGLYWPATEAVVADLTEGDERHEAYAVTRFADNLGLGVGVISGGALIGTTGVYRLLFIIDAISFVVFFAVVYWVIKESYQLILTPSSSTALSSRETAERIGHNRSVQGWVVAARDRCLLIYVLVNIIFTIYVSQTQSTLPLYLSKFVSVGTSAQGFSAIAISALFSWQMIVSILSLIPVSRALKPFSHPQALSISALLWTVGFVLIWLTGVASFSPVVWAILAMGVFAIATVSYTPSAVSLVADIAPAELRGIYLSINSLCWAAGYAIGPPLGGWAMDQPRSIVYGFWLALALSVVITIGILYYLDRILPTDD